MRWNWLLVLLVSFLAVSAPAHSQLRMPDIPQPVHGWLGLDVGEATLGGSALSGTEAAGTLRGEIGSLIGSRTSIVVNGVIVRPFRQSSGLACAPGPGNRSPITCAELSPSVSVNGLSGSLGYTWGQLGNTSRVITSIGGGVYGRTGEDGTPFGADASVKWTLADWGHVALVGTAQVIVLPNVGGRRVWIVPVTVGLRRH